MACCAKMHLPLLQVVAWTGMVVKYAQTAPLSTAIEMTFDGDHPCPLCLAIRKAQVGTTQEMKAPAPPENLLMIAPPDHPFVTLRLAMDGLPHPDFPAPGLSYRPPVPPPRSAA